MKVTKLVQRQETIGYKCDMCGAYRDGSQAYASLYAHNVTPDEYDDNGNKVWKSEMCDLCECCYNSVKKTIIRQGGTIQVD